ncbi:TlpA family protein disulfide reductase [Lutibacter sp.]
MKNLFVISVFCLITYQTFAQRVDLPNITIKNLENKNVDISSFKNEPLIILSFWATWCSNCIYELDEINDEYANWQLKTNVKLIAISIDDYRAISRVKPFLKSHQWPYLILLDTNQELKRAYNVNTIPYTLILKNGVVVYQKTGYSPTNLSDIYTALQKYLN